MTFEELKAKYAGRIVEPEVMEVEKGSIKRYAVAVGETNPAYLDDEAARKGDYGTIVAPPGFFGWPVKVTAPVGLWIMSDLLDDLRSAGFPNILDGGIDYEFSLPVRAGDTLVASTKVSHLISRKMAGSGMAMATFQTTYVNQDGNIVAVARQLVVALSAAAAAPAA